jgi:hypothetical protein
MSGWPCRGRVGRTGAVVAIPAAGVLNPAADRPPTAEARPGPDRHTRAAAAERTGAERIAPRAP